MDAVTLAHAMGNRLRGDQYSAYLDAFVGGMLAAGATTVNRAAMFCAQVGHESAGLRYMEEIADGSAYNNRRDLGNVQPGDGPRFKGRGPIQLTGRTNYGAFGRWCHGHGWVDSDDYFVRNPREVATPHWGFLAAAWYWTVARPRLNALSDAGDLVGATRAINGGTHGLDDRRSRWEWCLRIGAALLPGPGPAARPGPVVRPGSVPAAPPPLRRAPEDATMIITLDPTPRPPDVRVPMESWPMSGEISRPLIPAVASGWRGKGSISSLFVGWAGDPNDMMAPSGWIDYLRVISHPGGDYRKPPTIATVLDNARMVGNWTAAPIPLPEYCSGLLVRYAAPGSLNIGIEYEH